MNMGAALVVNNANFEQNRVAKVDFSDVPCTGLSISSDSFTLTEQGVGIDIGISVTPVDCTDAVIVTLGNEDIATTENGELFAKGIGETTLTVVCGNYTQTATITVPYIDVALKRFENNRIVPAEFGGTKDPLRTNPNVSYDGYALDYVPDGTAKAIYNGSSEIIAMVALVVNNAARVEVHQPENKGGYGYIRFANALTNSYTSTLANYISKTDYFDYNSNGVSDSAYSIPSGADSLAVEKNHASADAEMFVRFLPAAT